MEEKYKVAAYLRLSREDGDKEVSDSIVSQKSIIENKVDTLGANFEIVDYYIDDGYTGLNTNRPGFQKMLTDIEDKIINCIITKDLSRLSRNSFEANYYIEMYFLERNIRYISVLDNVDTGIKSANNDMIGFKTLINDWYSKDISRKIKSSVWARKEKGMFMGGVAPYGYKKSKEDKHKLIINKQEARIVRRIYDEYSKGKSITEIIKGLQNDNIPSPNNSSNNGEIRYKWREEMIRRMLCNKVYLGHLEYGKRINLSYKSKKRKYIPQDEWNIVYNTHEAIITEELFYKVQRVKSINKTIKRKKHEWELNGLVNCKECGAKMTLKVEYKRNNPKELKSKKLCCLNGLKRYKGKECIRKSKGIDEENFNQIICNSIKEVICFFNRSKIKELILKQLNGVLINRVSNKELLNKELGKIEDEMEILYLDYKQELLDEDDYKRYYKEKLRVKNSIKNELKILEESYKNIITEEKINELIENVLNMKELDKEFISEIVDDIKIDKDNQIYIYYKYDILRRWISLKEYRAGIYLRLSKEHDEENNSIEAQREITTKYAISKGYKIVKEYTDNGYSGILASRPELNKMMIDISRGFINMVIVKDISRLTRDKNKTGWYTEIFFPDNDVRFISVTELIDSGERYDIDDSIMLRGIANQSYIADISKKVRANKKAMKEKGQFVENCVPYGYKKDQEDKHKVIIDNDVAKNVRIIYEMYLNGKTSNYIAEYLNSQKIKNPSRYRKTKNASSKWSGETINDILSNPFYIGNTVMNKYETNYIKKTCRKNRNKESWIIKENTHQAIIEKEKYEKVQEIKESKKGTTRIKYKFLLKDLLYCGHCKKRLQYKIYKSSDKQRYLYDRAGFICNYFYKKKCKNKTYIREKYLNEIVKKEVMKRFDLIEIEKNTNKIIDYYNDNNEDMQKIKLYKKKQENLERRKSILYKKKCEQYITVEEFKVEYVKAKKEIEKYEEIIKSLEQNNKNKLDENKIREVIEQFKKGNYITNEFLKEIINKIEVYSNNRIDITYIL